MLEEWRDISAFPKYRVSNLGRVQNMKTERLLIPSTTKQGHAKVGMMSNGVAHTRLVSHIVAVSFLEPPPRKDFIALIHLDGDKQNCVVSNLMWRPHFFAIRYHKQFESSMWETSKHRVVDTKTGREYNTAQEASMEHGLVFTELIISAHNHTFVWPTYQWFQLISR